MNKDDLQNELCKQLCCTISLVERSDQKWMISAPFSYPDGDYYSIYLKETSEGKFRISDEANTIMKLSYDTPDVDKYFKGNRGKLMEQILQENKVKEDDGNFYVDTSIKQISASVFRLGQALNQIYDLSYLNRDRSTTTFYKDLENLLNNFSEKMACVLTKDYKVPELENAENYLVDYSFQKKQESFLFLFGIPSVDKAKLTTITLQHFILNKLRIPALIIFNNQEEISPPHLSRLMDANIAGSQVSSIESVDSIEKNIARYAA